MVLVEPHADDAWLSALFFLERYPVKIITVDDDPERLKEAYQFAKALGCEWEHRGLDELVFENEIAVVPLGVKHELHIKVREKVIAAEKWYYLDHPYGVKKSNLRIVNRLLKGREILWYYPNSTEKLKYSGIFKTQGRFVFYEKANIVKGAEVIVK